MAEITDLRKLLNEINKLREELGFSPREFQEGVDTSQTMRQEIKSLEGQIRSGLTFGERLGRDITGFLQQDPLGLEETIFGGLGPRPTDIITPRTQEILQTGQRFQPEAPAPVQVGQAPPTEPETFESGGFTFRKFVAPDGSVNFVPIGQAPREDAGITEFQQAGLDLREREFQTQLQQNEQQRINALRAQFGSAAGQRQFLQAQGQRTEADISRGIQADFAKQFEAFRQQVLGGTAPRGFFQREALRGEANPFAPDVTTVGDKIGGIQEELDRAEGSLNTVLKRATETTRRAKDPDDPLTISGIANPSTTEEFRARALFDERGERVQRVDQLREALNRAEDEFETSGEAALARPRAIGGGNFAVGAPEEPRRPRPEIQVPRALQEFFPEGIGGRFVTPSAQAINRLGFTGREQLFGGIEFRGEQPLDVLGDIEATLSTRRRGPTFTPFRQI